MTQEYAIYPPNAHMFSMISLVISLWYCSVMNWKYKINYCYSVVYKACFMTQNIIHLKKLPWAAESDMHSVSEG